MVGKSNKSRKKVESEPLVVSTSKTASTDKPVEHELDSRTQDELIHSPSRRDCRPYNNDPTLPLYRLEDVPHYLRDNPYILAAYRAYYPTKLCLHSIFRLHNETFNVWTHLMGFMVFVVAIFLLFSRHLVPQYMAGNVMAEVPTADGLGRRKVFVEGQRTAWPLLIFGFYSFGCLMCMLCSAFFHLFIAHISERFYSWAHALDYFGITVLTVGSFLPFCFYVFACEPFWRDVYLMMISTFGVIGMLGPFFRHWTSVAFASKKILFYVCMVGSGLFPIVHMTFFLPEDMGMPYVRGLLTMMFLYGFGVFIYAFKLPEIFAPGKFDVFLSSHQLWHLCVLGAALTHFYNCVDMYANYDKMLCDVPLKHA